MITGKRKAKELLVRYESRHRLDSNRRPKGRKMKRQRLDLYSKMDRTLGSFRTGLNEYIMDITRLRRPDGFKNVAFCPMMRWK